MRTYMCTNCGFAAARELPQCPQCRKKALVFQHSFSTSTYQYERLMRSRESDGSHPLASMMIVGALATGMAFMLFTWMFPHKAFMAAQDGQTVAASTFAGTH